MAFCSISILLRLNMVFTHGFPPDFRGGGVHIFLFKPLYAIGSVPSLSGHAVVHHCRESAGTGPVVLKVV